MKCLDSRWKRRTENVKERQKRTTQKLKINKKPEIKAKPDDLIINLAIEARKRKLSIPLLILLKLLILLNSSKTFAQVAKKNQKKYQKLAVFPLFKSSFSLIISLRRYLVSRDEIPLLPKKRKKEKKEGKNGSE